MDAQALAKEYVRCFCHGDLSGMSAILAEDFHIRGPLYEFNSRQAFIDRLASLNAPTAEYDVLSCIACIDEACVFFRYQLGKLDLTMAMQFLCAGNRIRSALLVFDTARLPRRP